MFDMQTMQLLTERITNKSLEACICAQAVEGGVTTDYRILYFNEAFLTFIARENKMVQKNTSLKELLAIMGVKKSDIIKLTDEVINKGKNQICYWSGKLLYKIFSFKIMEDGVVLLFYENIDDRKVGQEQISPYENQTILKVYKDSLEEERIYQLVSDYANDGFLYCNYQEQSYFASKRWFQLFPISKNRLSDKACIYDCIQEKDRVDYEKKRLESIRQRSIEAEYYYELKKGNIYIHQTTHFEYDKEGRLTEEIAFYKDITKEWIQRTELEHMAYYDIFTNIYNRNYFTRWLDQRIREASELGYTIQMIYIDIDHFKWVNDSMGMHIGDEMLLRFVEILKIFETNDIQLGRFSNDEFGIGIGGTRDKDCAERIARQLVDRLKMPINLSNGIDYYITVSIGIAETGTEIKSAIELIQAADLAMFDIKRSGRNGMAYYKNGMMRDFVNIVTLEQRLQLAVEKLNFYLFYQPQYNISTDRLRGVEALIRWKDEELGYVKPSDFIPLAEENGTIQQIGEWVIQEGLVTLSRWCEKYQYQGIMSLNISAVQFRNGRFLNILEYYTSYYHLNPNQIEIELTESVLIDDIIETKALIKKIRDLGYKVSLDDFGTGYSSLSYLREVPIDTLKIDRSFITSILSDVNTGIITSSVIEMVQRLGLETIAEGVETKEQLDYLKNIHCINIQGYFLGKPMAEEEVVKLLTVSDSLSAIGGEILTE